MGLYQYIREQEHRSDLVGELGKWMSKNYGLRPDHSSYAFELASKEFEACGNWTRQEAVERLNQNKELQKIIKIEPQIGEIITDVLKTRPREGYDRDKAYTKFKSRVSKLIGFFGKSEELGNAESYDVVIQTIVHLLPPDASDLYPDGFPEELYLDL